MNSSSEPATPNVVTFRYTEASGEGETPLFEGLWEDPTQNRSRAEAESREAVARREGIHEGEVQARKVFEQELSEIKAALATAIHAFTQERGAYLKALERESVKLSVSIARRILRRETQVDGTLLYALARSALQELEHSSGVRLLVMPTEVGDWQAYFDRSDVRMEKPEIVADRNLSRHECRIESRMGTTTLSLENQLNEIETGLFDLLNREVKDETVQMDRVQ